MSRDTSRGTAPVAVVCEAFTISRQAYYAAQRPTLLRAAPTEREKQTQMQVSDATLLREIRRVLMRFPAWGVRKTWAFLRREGIRAARERVWKMMQAHGLTLPALSERPVPLRRGRVAVPESNRRWATDLTTTWTARDGTVALVPVIDCGDRFVFDIEVTKSQEAPAVLAPLAQALHDVFAHRAAVPHGLELRSDHGPQYTGSDCEKLSTSGAWRTPSLPSDDPRETPWLSASSRRSRSSCSGHATGTLLSSFVRLFVSGYTATTTSDHIKR